MTKKLFCTCTTSGGYHYYYDACKNYLIVLNKVAKYIIENHLYSGGIDISSCSSDIYLNQQDQDCVDYCMREINFLIGKGFFSSQDENPISPLELTTIQIKDNFASSNNLVLEVTERCNLRCKYCIYGDCYTDFTHRGNCDMTFEIAKAIIDYKVNMWLSNNNNSAKITKIIGFYGGEPLLNMGMIKQVVSYIKTIEEKHALKFKFGMTTNGILLNKYIDFLVENNFSLTVSIDGNAYHNQYRVFSNNKPSFPILIGNITEVQEKYRDYFDKNVSFNTVAHNKSDINEIYAFFKDMFNKKPDIIPLNPLGNSTELQRISYKGNEEIVSNNSNVLFNLRNDTSKLFLIDIYLSHYSLLSPISPQNIFTTGTCIPFSKKVFVTAKGTIMMCEKISPKFALGEVKNVNSISIDFAKAARRFNILLKERMVKCKNCYNLISCSECLFVLDNLICSEFTTKEKFRLDTASKIHNHEQLVSSVNNDGYWLYFNQFVYFTTRDSNALIYNELNNSYLMLNNITDSILLNVIDRFNSIIDETYVIELKRSELSNSTVQKFVKDIQNNFSGSLIRKENQIKPFVRRPSIHIINVVEYMNVDDEYLISYRLKLSVSEITINTGLNSNKSSNWHIFKSNLTKPSKYEIYDYLDPIAKQISEYRYIRQVNIICYHDSLFDKLDIFAKSIKNMSLVCIHSEISIASSVIDKLGDEYVYYIYLEPSESDFELLAELNSGKSCTIIPFVNIKDDSDIFNLNKLSEKYSIECNIFPIFNLNSTLLNHFIKSEEDILEQQLSVKEININGILNKNIFGKVYINEHGGMSAINTKESLFNLKNHSILDFVFDQIRHKKEWFLIRSLVPGCKGCIFQKVCPPISKEEMLLEKYDLCNIN